MGLERDVTGWTRNISGRNAVTRREKAYQTNKLCNLYASGRIPLKGGIGGSLLDFRGNKIAAPKARHNEHDNQIKPEWGGRGRCGGEDTPGCLADLQGVKRTPRLSTTGGEKKALTLGHGKSF